MIFFSPETTKTEIKGWKKGLNSKKKTVFFFIMDYVTNKVLSYSLLDFVLHVVDGLLLH